MTAFVLQNRAVVKRPGSLAPGVIVWPARPDMFTTGCFAKRLPTPAALRKSEGIVVITAVVWKSSEPVHFNVNAFICPANIS